MRSFIPRSCGVNIIAQGLDKGDKWSAGTEPRDVIKQGSRIISPCNRIGIGSTLRTWLLGVRIPPRVLHISGRSPAEETADLSSAKGGFESHRPYFKIFGHFKLKLVLLF